MIARFTPPRSGARLATAPAVQPLGATIFLPTHMCYRAERQRAATPVTLLRQGTALELPELRRLAIFRSPLNTFAPLLVVEERINRFAKLAGTAGVSVL